MTMHEPNRDELRAHLVLHSLLPLLKVVYADRPEWPRRFAGMRAVVQFDVAYTAMGAYLRFAGDRFDVVAGLHPRPDLGVSFKSRAALADFFTGKPVLPRIRGALRHPVLAAHIPWFLSTLRVLTPKSKSLSFQDRALHVKLVLYLATHALSQMNKAGHPDVVALVADSPDRVYQWTVQESGASAYLRMHRGKTRAGRGVYTGRRPFVQYTFPTVDGAYRIFTTTRSQMEGVVRGDVVPEGSPEYSRKIGILIQKIDALLAGEP